MSRPKTKTFRTYSFKCLEGRDDDLINLLNAERADRSRLIRETLRIGRQMPRPADPTMLDLDTFRAELGVAVEYILANIPAVSRQEKTVRARRAPDVNKNGGRIPDF